MFALTFSLGDILISSHIFIEAWVMGREHRGISNCIMPHYAKREQNVARVGGEHHGLKYGYEFKGKASVPRCSEGG